MISTRIVLDSNIFIHASNEASPLREKAGEIVDASLTGALKAAITPQIVSEFYSVVTDTRRLNPPMTPRRASEISRSLLATPTLSVLLPTVSGYSEAFRLAAEHDLKNGDFFDCVLACTARENGVDTIYTQNESDFRRFGFLKVVNPFAEP